MIAPRPYRIVPITVVVLLLEALAWGVGLVLWNVLEHRVPAFRLERPWVLWGLAAGPLLTALFLVDLVRRERALTRFAAPALAARISTPISSLRTTVRFLLLRHGLTFVVLALAGPQLGTRLEEVKAQGVDVVVALDVSNSMMAEDLAPNRMEVARRALEQLIDRMKGDRLGIVVFAGEPYVQLPLTADRSAARLFLGSIGPGMLSVQGTAVGAAIERAARCFPEKADAGRAIIVISDGESFEDDGEAAAQAAAEQGIVVHTVGMGSPQGSPIPERRNGTMLGFKKDRQGQTVMTKLNEDMLKRIAAAGKGAYVKATATDTGIQALVADLKKMDQREAGTYRYAGHEDRYQPVLALGCVMLLLGLLFGDRPLRFNLRLP
ncbi:MAG: VWA domain-containing protein [Flavobacteriales bacterium]|nr:VWA domain-containing protein [Flavobacteriales bacterium]